MRRFICGFPKRKPCIFRPSSPRKVARSAGRSSDRCILPNSQKEKREGCFFQVSDISLNSPSHFVTAPSERELGQRVRALRLRERSE